MIFVIHLVLALVLFFLINWIGRHSHSLGYISLGIFVRRDEAPAFNLALRILGPLAFVVIAATFFYALGLDEYVGGIWKISLYYFFGRAVFNIFMGRFLLINWGREVVIASLCIGGTWVIYEAVIKHKIALVPDFKTAANELWVVIAFFVYAILNKIDTGTKGSEIRKQRYIKQRFRVLRERYSSVVENTFADDLSQAIGMTVLLYETFNRPWLAQRIEHVVFPLWGKSLGPMQVTTSHRVDDAESVRLGFERVMESYRKWHELAPHSHPDLSQDKYWLIGHLARRVAADYNKDEQYVTDIDELNRIVVSLFYPQLLKK